MNIYNIKKTIKEGLPVREIAKMYGLPVAVIAQYKREMKPTIKKMTEREKDKARYKAEDLYREGKTYRDIMKATGLTRMQVAHHISKVPGLRKRQPRKKTSGGFTPDAKVIQRIHQLAIFDYTPSEIAEDVGIPTYNVRNVIYTLGLRENKA